MRGTKTGISNHRTGPTKIPVTARVLGALAVVLLVAVPVLALTAMGPGLFAFEAPSVEPHTPNPMTTAEPDAQGAPVLEDWRFTQRRNLTPA